ncbi:hypothetical protein [Nocardia arthritidis]|uniref:Uncharacterized protein n=1 Tax=Nocardia arthritidis TaxID=228602 RepID=A0A6G9Y799_9NOCA|nr:hypothetical protein [Nocardia arthritidis]QIS08933.1 hypothetical protein F5544_05105 [Nocardia arthritidis]
MQADEDAERAAIARVGLRMRVAPLKVQPWIPAIAFTVSGVPGERGYISRPLPDEAVDGFGQRGDLG